MEVAKFITKNDKLQPFGRGEIESTKTSNMQNDSVLKVFENTRIPNKLLVSKTRRNRFFRFLFFLKYWFRLLTITKAELFVILLVLLTVADCYVLD